MKSRTGDLCKYENADYSLQMSSVARELLIQDKVEFIKCCDGVGSRAGGWMGNITYHITPNTIWLMDITPASDIHDVEYSHPLFFATGEDAKAAWKAANERFVDNCVDLAVARGGWLLKARLHRIHLYGKALAMDTAWQAFMAHRSVVSRRLSRA
jgi:hypothetical protein